MKPVRFRLSRPTELDEALAILAEHSDDAVVMAGGQSLVPLLNLRMARPEIVVDLSRIESLRTIACADHTVTVGAMARARAVELDGKVRAILPALGDALAYVGHPQIRNRSTVGGMVAFADPAAEIPAVLRACDGRVHLRRRGGAREVEAADFFVGPYVTGRADDELLTAVDFAVPASLRFHVSEHTRRHGDFAIAGAVVGADVEQGHLRALRLCYFGVGAVPRRLTELEQRFGDRELDDQLIDEIAGGVEELITPPSDVHGSADYRRRTAGVLTKRSLCTLREGALNDG
jgi:carbon-monoxide dehydrogenase medium subunit